MDELIDMHVSTTNSDQNLITFFTFNVNTLLTKLINALTFSEEHDFHVFSFWVTIQKFAQLLINLIIFMSNIYSLPGLKISILLHQLLVLFLSFFKLVIYKFQLVEEIKLDDF